MDNCLLCMEDSSVSTEFQLEIYSDEGLKLEIAKIISKHFLLQLDKNADKSKKVCTACWAIVRDFNILYERVAASHSSKTETKEIWLEHDPLPLGMFQKPEGDCNDLRMEPPDNSYFYPEVKVEEHELDQLPQIEVMENPIDLEEKSPQRTTRRRRQQTTVKKTTAATKRVKKEEKDDIAIPEVCVESDVTTSLPTIEPESNNGELPASEPQKKRRGRPRKAKGEEVKEVTEPDVSIEPKTEHHFSDSDAEDALDDTAASHGTDDSDSSNSSDDSDSDYLTNDKRADGKIAIIPKRVSIRPKKYKKRPKPLVAPVRMTREEIEQRKAQQAEYDEILAKFFDKFECPLCNLLVQNFGDMMRHFRITHNIEHGYMNCCGRKFTTRKAMAEHVLLHWNPEHFKCSICSKILQNSHFLKMHELSHTNPTEPKQKEVYQCEKCPKSFTNKTAFEYHNSSKHVPKSEFKFSCPECDKKLLTERKLKNHIKSMHDPEHAIICDKCGKQMRTSHSLKKHQELMHSDAPRPEPILMQCQICGTWLKNMSGLKQHMKSIHEEAAGEHRCHICGKVSPNSRALRRHIYHNHECERKFKCTMCEKAFKRPQELREHTSTHTGEVLYTCPNCPMTFFCSANMYKHRQRLHRAQYEADKNQPRPPNILQRAVGATAATKMKLKLSAGISSAFLSKMDQEMNYR